MEGVKKYKIGGVVYLSIDFFNFPEFGWVLITNYDTRESRVYEIRNGDVIKDLYEKIIIRESDGALVAGQRTRACLEILCGSDSENPDMIDSGLSYTAITKMLS